MDLFEEELEGDYEEMLSKFEKKKVLQVRGSLVRSENGVGGRKLWLWMVCSPRRAQRMESQGQSVMAEGAYLRVLLGHTGQQLVVPFEPTTAVSTAVDIILQKQPLAHPQVLLTHITPRRRPPYMSRDLTRPVIDDREH